MKQLIISLALILSFLAPALASENDPFIAIFTDETLQWNYADNVHKKDLFWVAKDWSTLDAFLIEAKRRASGRRLIIDISCHGLPMVFVLGAGNGKRSYLCTVGALISHIEKNIPSEQIDYVCLESCYSGHCYSRSFHPGDELINPKAKKCLLEGRQAPNPSFPVYGLASARNIPPAVLEQALHKQFLTIEDLRQFEHKQAPNLDKEAEQLTVYLQKLILARILVQQDKVFRD